MRDVFEASDHAEKLMHESMLRPDFIEGITAFFEKRTPNFPPLKEVTLNMTLDYRAIDVDNHYYEPIDSFTRHLPKEFKRRGVQMVTDGKRTLAVMGGVVNHFIPNPTFDPIIEPGCLDLLFRGEIPEGVDPASLMKVDRLADHPEYQNRDARVKVLDRRTSRRCSCCRPSPAVSRRRSSTTSRRRWRRCTPSTCGSTRTGVSTVPTTGSSRRRSSRWPTPTRPSRKSSSCWAAAPRSCCVRPAPVPGVVKPRSLGDPLHDPVWARLAEAGVPVVFHLSDSGYLAIAALWGGKATFEGFGKKDPLDRCCSTTAPSTTRWPR